MSSVADIVELQEERSKRAPLTDEEFQTAGAMLRAAREAAGYSLEDAHDATNVRADYLEAIEEMDTSRLPIAAYTTGFVKAYAQFLELPDEPLVARFRKEAGYGAGAALAPDVPSASREDVTAGRELSLLAVVAILFFVIWVAFQITRPPADTGPVAVEGTPLQQRPSEQMAEPTYTVANEAADETALSTDNDIAVTERSDDVGTSPGFETETSGAALASEAGAGDLAELSGTEPELLVTESDAVADVTDLSPSDAVDLNAQQLELSTDSGQLIDAVDEAIELPLAETFPLEVAPEDVVDTVVVQETPSEPLVEQPLPEATPAPAALVAPVVTDAVRLSSVSPVYPSRCQRRADGTERVTVMFDIDSRGRTVNQRVSQSSNSCFDGASLNAIDRWTFEPATRDGAPVPVFGQTTTFVYNLPE
ncbi:MAG: TonB family protein [Aquisalinus sp.]|nr:TonB family protein [Aquisalinus sp.]